MRIALGLEYNGKNYHGWQFQVGLTTVQATVEAAVSKIADHDVRVVCAGRTDVGVHAKEQVIHFDTEVIRRIDSWILGTNNYLPRDIRIKWAKVVSAEFHARFSAIARHYCYVIHNNPIRSAILDGLVSWHLPKLNVALMQEAAQYLIGEHDFSSFRGSSCQSKSVMRNVMLLQVKKRGGLITIDVRANAFLLHMVRNIVGVLTAIGEGKQTPKWAQDVLLKRDRTAAACTAPASGLYLKKVYYLKRYSEY